MREASSMLGLLTLQVDVQNFALVTHAVPAERVRPLIPSPLELETHTEPWGRETTLISTSCFCNRQLHWTPLRYPAVDFNQTTFRTYVGYRGRRGVHFVGTFVDTKQSFVAQSALAARSRYASFETDIDGGVDGYPHYEMRASPGDEEVSFEVRATSRPRAKPPFSTSAEYVDYITYRLHGFARNPLGFVTHGPIDHRRFDPWEGELIRGRFDFWRNLGILTEEEEGDAYSVLVEPSVRFTLKFPRAAL